MFGWDQINYQSMYQKLITWCFIELGGKNNNPNNIFLNNPILTKVNYTNFWGIILDNKLN